MSGRGRLPGRLRRGPRLLLGVASPGQRPARRRPASGRCRCSARRPGDDADGRAPRGEPGEAWGYRQLPLAVGERPGRHPRARLRPGRQSGPARSAARLPAPHRRQRLAGLRHPGRRVRQPYRGPIPNRLSARITREGGGVLVGRDLRRPVGEQVVVLAPRPGRRLARARRPAAEVLLPAEGGAAGRGARRRPGLGGGRRRRLRRGRPHRSALRPQRAARSPTGSSTSTARNGAREPIEDPRRLRETTFHILAIDATGLGNAWAMAEADEAGLNRSRRPAASGPSTPDRAALGRAAAGRDALRRARQPRRGDRRRGPDRRRRAAADRDRRRRLDRPDGDDRRRRRAT